MKKLSDVFQSVKNYFDLGAVPDRGDGHFNFIVQAKPTSSQSFGESIKRYFDLNSGYKIARNAVDEIMRLAIAEEVTDGRLYSSIKDTKSGFQYRDNDFELKLEMDGVIFLKCDTAFADKVRNLPSVSAVINPLNLTRPFQRTSGPVQN